MILEFIFGAAALISAGLMQETDENTIVLLEDPDGNVGEITIITNDGQQQRITSKNTGLVVSDEGKAADETVAFNQEELFEIFGSVIKAHPLPPTSHLLYFDLNSSELNVESYAIIKAILHEIKKRPVAKLSVIGHSDTAGSQTLNAQLSYTRAIIVRDALLKNGVPEDRIDVYSHGENDLLIPTEDNVAEPYNRRVEILIR